MEMPRSQVILPPTYYLDHFREMIAFVLRVYGALLRPEPSGFIADFEGLSFKAQCLFVRMQNRKRAVFALRDLDYREIGDVRDGMEELLAKGMARPIGADDYSACLDVASKTELIALAREKGLSGVKSGWSKAEVVAAMAEVLSFDVFAEARETGEMYVPEHKETLGFLLFIYFGKLNDNLGAFALRDMGIVSVRPQETYGARFESMAEAEAGYAYIRALQGLREGTMCDLKSMPQSVSTFTQAVRDKFIFALGQRQEKAKSLDAALETYRQGKSFECHERVVRLLYAKGDQEAAKVLLDEMLQTPAHDEEYIFASDFFARKFGQTRTGVYTTLLRDCEIISVDDLYRGHAELAAIGHFERQGWQASHVENGLWPAVFGLLFWEPLFESDAAMSSAFDHLPLALKNRTFQTHFAADIVRVLADLRSGEGLPGIARAFAGHYGQPNGLFDWSDELLEILKRLFATANPLGIAGVIERMTHAYLDLRDGFPDLMLTRGTELKFVEIKAEGDQIRRHQLARLNWLKDLGFTAEIARIAYRSNPEQTYVVIDVETTGGRAPHDRVTEIGAVKVRGGEIVAEWQSLINPQRRIPAFITDLTGISNEMVSDAPCFRDIADELEAFLGDAVFVAHNVNFDYGFVSSEYKRLERRFTRPKLCTCASMRRYYPGHASYGLAAMSRAFSIDLKNHHRALADARAAAQLLLLVNEKRVELAAVA